MSYVIDRPIMTFVRDERARCAALARAIGPETSFLIFCIDNSYEINETERAREMFDQLQPIEKTETVEDLM